MGSQPWLPGSEKSAWPGNMLEMQIFSSSPVQGNLKLTVRPSHMFSRVIQMTFTCRDLKTVDVSKLCQKNCVVSKIQVYLSGFLLFLRNFELLYDF